MIGTLVAVSLVGAAAGALVGMAAAHQLTYQILKRLQSRSTPATGKTPHLSA